MHLFELGQGRRGQPSQAARCPPMACGCSRKNRSISREASTPCALVWLPRASPPDQAWPAPWSQCSAAAPRPALRRRAARCGCSAGRRHCGRPRCGAERAPPTAAELLAIARVHRAVRFAVEDDERYVAGGDCAGCRQTLGAAFHGRERAPSCSGLRREPGRKCTPAAANTSGYSRASSAAMAPPADRPAT